MNTRKLILALIVAGFLSVGFGTLPSAGAGYDPGSLMAQIDLGGGGGDNDDEDKDNEDEEEEDNVVEDVVDTVGDVLGGDQGGDTGEGDEQPEQPATQENNSTPDDTSDASKEAGTTEEPQPLPGTTPTVQTTATTAEPKRPANARPRKAPAPEAEEEDEDDTDRTETGPPTPANPSYSLALPGAVPVGVPNFFIDKFRIPPFLLPIYQAAGIEYGVPWQVLAAINEIETDYGRNLNVSSAGAMGWMQFIPSSWKAYGVDANNDRRKDPYNPVDAIFAAARYLRAAGSETDLRRAIFAYNHADWYVESVMLRARLIGGLPDDLVGALTGLTQAHFPVAARAVYADDGAAAIDIYSRPGAPVIAVNDGVVRRIGESKRLGRYVVLEDVYGNAYTYAHLGKVAPSYPTPKPRPVSAAEIRRTMASPPRDPKPLRPASAGRQLVADDDGGERTPTRRRVTVAKERLFASPGRPNSYRAGGEQQLLMSGKPVAGYTTFESYFKQVLGLDRDDVVLRKLRPGAHVIGGTVLGRIEKTMPTRAAHLHFAIRPAGEKSPAIDPKPILDGWKLLESTAIYRAAGKNPFFGPDARHLSVGQIMLLNKETLQRRVLADPRIEIYECGRRDIQSGRIDRRVLATIEFLAASGLRRTITSLTCGHSYFTKGGSVSHHSSGNAVDIAAVNGIPILGHQGRGSITEMAVRRLLTLQGVMKPSQIISLMTFQGADNTFSMSDHADHIHVGFQPPAGPARKIGQPLAAVLEPKQWARLTNRMNEIYRQHPVARAIRSKTAEAAVSASVRQLRAPAPAQARDVALRLAIQSALQAEGRWISYPGVESGDPGNGNSDALRGSGSGAFSGRLGPGGAEPR
jgi:hypothetical protein